MKGMLPGKTFLIKDEITGFCLEAENDKLKSAVCDTGSKNQKFHAQFSTLKNIGSETCLDANAQIEEKNGMEILLYDCMSGNANQKWHIQKGALRWGKFCGKFPSLGGKVILGKCSDGFLTSGKAEGHKFVNFNEMPFTGG